jgi:hypothetical protein
MVSFCVGNNGLPNSLKASFLILCWRTTAPSTTTSLGLAALTAVMDVSVLIMVGVDGVRTLQAQLTFATARLALIEMGRVLGAGPRPFEEQRLSSGGFAEIKSRLTAARLGFVDEEQAEERLAAFRDTYEPFLNGLAHHLLLSLPAWSPTVEQLDNWMNSPRGRSAKRLLDSVESEPGTSNS